MAAENYIVYGFAIFVFAYLPLTDAIGQAQNKRNQQAINTAVRQQQEWMRKQVPANSVLYKMNYPTTPPPVQPYKQKDLPTIAMPASGLTRQPAGTPGMNAFAVVHASYAKQERLLSTRKPMLLSDDELASRMLRQNGGFVSHWPR